MGLGKIFIMLLLDGMILRVIYMIYDIIIKLKEKFWLYIMEGLFIEVYNEDFNDFLICNNGFEEKLKKFEICYDENCKQIYIMNCRFVCLDLLVKVEMMFEEVQKN